MAKVFSDFEKHYFQGKIAVATFGATFGNFRTFLLQHLVTLLGTYNLVPFGENDH